MSQVVNEQDEAGDLSRAATSIFAGSSNTFKLRSGKQAVIRPATMEHLAPTLRFFKAVMESMSPESLGRLVDLIADAQKKAIVSGQDPANIDVQALMSQTQEMTGKQVVQKVIGNAGIVTELFAAVMDELPYMVSVFTNVTEDEFKRLEPDEGIVLAGGIFTVNYAFFTRSLPPILTAAARGWASHIVAKSRAVPTPVATSKLKRRIK